MSYSSTTDYTKSLTSKYLSNCDLINKYKLSSLNKKPILRNISLELTYSNIFESLDKLTKNESDSEIQVKSFLILYIFKLFQPLVDFGGTAKIKEAKSGWSIRILLSEEEDLHFFLKTIFIENISKILVEDFSFFHTQNNILYDIGSDQKTCLVNSKIPVESFYEIDNFLTKNLLGISPEKLNVDVKFLFQNNNITDQNSSIKLIKNTQLFWAAC
jgi:hypothetical protein